MAAPCDVHDLGGIEVEPATVFVLACVVQESRVDGDKRIDTNYDLL